DRQEQEPRRDGGAPAPPATVAGAGVDVREPDRVPHTPALRERVEADCERDQEQGEQEEGLRERREPPPHTAPTWTIPRTPCTLMPERARASTREPRMECVAETLWISAWLGGVAEEKPMACQPETKG